MFQRMFVTSSISSPDMLGNMAGTARTSPAASSPPPVSPSSNSCAPHWPHLQRPLHMLLPLDVAHVHRQVLVGLILSRRLHHIRHDAPSRHRVPVQVHHQLPKRGH